MADADLGRRLYICRPVLNPRVLRRLARDHGVVLDRTGFHLTVALSRTLPAEESTPETDIFISARVPLLGQHLRGLETFSGQGGSLVGLRVEHDGLNARHARLLASGCTWDFPRYRAHITLGRLGPSTALGPVGRVPRIILCAEARRAYP